MAFFSTDGEITVCNSGVGEYNLAYGTIRNAYIPVNEGRLPWRAESILRNSAVIVRRL